MLKTCGRCREQKRYEEFNKSKGRKDGLQPICKNCERQYKMAKRYGLNQEQYDAMYKKQGGLCKCCRVRPIEKIDHCHRSGAVRGLTCGGCNLAFGHMRDNWWTALRACYYLWATQA